MPVQVEARQVLAVLGVAQLLQVVMVEVPQEETTLAMVVRVALLLVMVETRLEQRRVVTAATLTYLRAVLARVAARGPRAAVS